MRSRRSADEDLSTELKSHLQLLTEENIRRGMNESDARAAAIREFGGIEQTKENIATSANCRSLSRCFKIQNSRCAV